MECAYLHLDLLLLYNENGPLNQHDSYRDVALQCVVLKLYAYALNRSISDWAETEGVIPERQHGFRTNRSTTCGTNYQPLQHRHHHSTVALL